MRKTARNQLPPASMTKIMTMLLIMEALDEGKLSIWMKKFVLVSMQLLWGAHKSFWKPGEEMTVKEMMKGIAIGSGNDASVAMAERIAGSEEAFVDMMNKKVKELGLKDTKFQNTTGLPVEDHYSSANDMAIMAKGIIEI